MKDLAPTPGTPVDIGRAVYGVALKREPRRGSRRKKPLLVMAAGVIYVRWVGKAPTDLPAPVWWDDKRQACCLRKPRGAGQFLHGWRIVASPEVGEGGEVVAKVAVG